MENNKSKQFSRDEIRRALVSDMKDKLEQRINQALEKAMNNPIGTKEDKLRVADNLRAKIIGTHEKFLAKNKDKLDDLTDKILREQELKQMEANYEKQLVDLENT